MRDVFGEKVMKKEKCPVCQKDTEYIEFECNEAFTSPAELAFKALNVWGAYSAPKETICEAPEFVHFRFLGNGTEQLVKMLGFDREKFASEQEKLRAEKQPCEHRDENSKSACDKEGNAVFSMFQPDEPIGFFCDEHCFENGACPGCYYFLAGWESFDFSQSGYCDECDAAFRQDFSDDCDDDEYNYGDDEDFVALGYEV
jgi:predicted amidophosphoribosyltransferase